MDCWEPDPEDAETQEEKALRSEDGAEGARTPVCLLMGRDWRPGVATSPARVPPKTE